MQKTNLNLKAFPLEKVIKNLSKEQTTERQQKIKEILSLREIVGSEHTTELIEALTTADQLTGPDENGNYILTKNEEMQLIDKYGEPIGDLSDDPIMQSVINTYLDTTNESEKLGALTFDYLLPYKKGIYLARKGQNLFYIDAITGLPIEEDKKDTITLQRQEHKEVINQVFSSILFTYDIYLINKKGIDFSQLMETSEKLTKNYKKLINALYGVYRYLYHGEITPQLA
ncbi:MAG: hypothetical protein LBO09_02725 [Candidatus Peribacteria bacterium]|jgi:hypothetical protein|nr:hypothetical protein [Candidatus Peribacteria bacterium]